MILLNLERTIRKRTVFFRIENMWPAVGIGLSTMIAKRKIVFTIPVGPLSITLCAYRPQFTGVVGRTLTFDDERGEFVCEDFSLKGNEARKKLKEMGLQ